ncbi:MAG: helix-turn-helix domain-containing protein [Nanoarchaeota archaeon]
MNTILLESLGLTHNEALAYITLSRIGSSKTGRLLKESGLNTGKVYEILDSLKRKGLVSETIIDNVMHFAAAPPDRLIEYIKKKKDMLEKEEKVAKSLIPEIEKIRQAKLPISRIVVYTGFDGFKTAVNEATKTLKPKEEVLAMGVRASKGEEFNRYWTQWAEQTLPKNHERVIFSDKGAFYDYKLKSKFSKIRFLESSTPNAIVIFGEHTLLIAQYDSPVRVIFINDELAAGTFISLFEQLWKVAKK